MQNYLQAVREQYERYPYPLRKPEDERLRLLTTWNDHLAQINHYCFAGKQTFRDGFKVLVAGGGTGDNVIFLAEQLRETDATIVHLDLSAASLAVAKKRARIRGLGNIQFIQESLLELPRLAQELKIGPFDFINCCGVLHHLASPEQGLEALLSQLKSDGAMNLMVYGEIGRTAVYQVQALAKLAAQGEADPGAQIKRTRDLIASLPKSNWWKRSEDLLPSALEDDVGFFDTFLHPQDCAYTVAQLYSWIADKVGLYMQLSDVGFGQSSYVPERHLRNQTRGLKESIAALPLRERQAFAELACGRILTHSFYATRRTGAAVTAQVTELDNVPFLFLDPVTGAELAPHFDRRPGETVRIDHSHTGTALEFTAGRYGKYLMRHLDGKRSLREIFDKVKSEPELRNEPPSHDALIAEFAPIFMGFNEIERMLLRHRSTLAFPDALQLQSRAAAHFA
jgi:2-polyprenyl-3-methyl-5-hydroxy-6-metoxy-1,4-benzoquinol methylase